MFSFLLSRIKPEDDYEFFDYNGRQDVEVTFRGNPLYITKGMRFGVRKSSNGKLIRLIFPDNPTRVITIDLETAKKLAKGIK